MGEATANFERFKHHFSLKLRELSQKNGSINKVCSDLKINRQQFAKYLSGATLPSVYMLQRCITYFDVDPSVFFLKRAQRKLSQDHVAEDDQVPALPEGFYMDYSMSNSEADTVEIGLWRFERNARVLLCFGQLPDPRIRRGLAGYSGVVSTLGSHYLLKAKADNPNVIAVMTLSKLEFSINDLCALKITADSIRGTMQESRTILRYIGEKIEIAEVLAERCGLLAYSALDETSRAVVDNLADRTIARNRG